MQWFSNANRQYSARNFDSAGQVDKDVITILPIAQDIICLIAKIEDLPVIEPDPLEECFISRAVEKRKIEFRAGRNLARLALKHLGNDAITIPARENRLPDWPDGFIGSLSHTRSHVGVVVAKSSSFQSIGFDIENLRSIETSLYPHLLRKEEIAEVQREDIDPSVYFSGKEAAFKAVFQVHEEYFEFTDLRLLHRALVGYRRSSPPHERRIQVCLRVRRDSAV